ncbi:MAG TPA: A/G-specific adenine glycosylase [Anaeromyxobacteraceae bacterium]|nr:A/G-specific adenine glycosylase [Anaeromyxobacteraceae bacterium]
MPSPGARRPEPGARSLERSAASGVRSSRRAAIRRRLLAWWDAGHRDLPWRFPQRAADPYRVWLAEVMLQQTRVEAVVPYYRRFLGRFPTLEALAGAPEDEVLALWSGLGYYARARNLHRAARTALARHGGLPAELAALRALPGFGPYTAGAVASIAFAIPAPAVDGNAARVLSRLFLVEGDPAAAGTARRLRALAADLVAAGEGARRPGDLNQALMELGATLCGRAPSCGRCPLAPTCGALEAGRERELPVPRRRPRRRELHLACALVLERGRVLLARGRSGGLFGGLWGLPSVPLDRSARARAALRAGIRSAHGVDLEVGRLAGEVRRALTHRDLRLSAYRSRMQGGPGSGALRFFALSRLGGVGLPAAARALLRASLPEAPES